MSDPTTVLYRKVDDLEYWNLPESDITQEIYDGLTASQRRELKAAPGYELVPETDLTLLNRAELEAHVTEHGFAGPVGTDLYKTKADLIAAFTNPGTVPPAETGGEHGPASDPVQTDGNTEGGD